MQQNYEMVSKNRIKTDCNFENRLSTGDESNTDFSTLTFK